jgi:3-oxoacyl-[acyl-carrier protein] reductase
VDLGPTDRVVVITGGGGAICRQIGRRFAEAGGRIVFLDVKPPADGGDGARFVPCDVRVDADVRRAVATVTGELGRIDVLVNGAGVMTWALLADLDEAEWDRVVDINLKGTFLVSRAVAPVMTAQKSGQIVNIASGLGHTPFVEVGHYAAAKAGVIALTKTLALELAPHRVRVNAVAPGAIDTPLIAPRRSRAEIEAIGARIPLGRIGHPDDVAKVVVFLASTAADYMTGQTLFINGGALMP